jgi:hypothetical protein
VQVRENGLGGFEAGLRRGGGSFIIDVVNGVVLSMVITDAVISSSPLMLSSCHH